jgi:NADPH:quinone reductase-like Zn-dependent oxidoreductase
VEKRLATVLHVPYIRLIVAGHPPYITITALKLPGASGVYPPVNLNQITNHSPTTMPDQTKYTSKINGSRILILGGTSGIGFCVAEACTENGALVTIASSSADRVKKAVEKLNASYPSAKERVFGLTVNLSDAETLENELKTLLEKTVKEMGGEKLDHVIFTAGDALATIKLEDMVCMP